MRRIFLIDIDNCIANVNKELQKRGHRTDVYPSPMPSNVFEDGSVFKNAEPIPYMIKIIEKLTGYGQDRSIFLTARSSKENIHKITQKWIVQNTPFEFPLYYTNGVPKGKLIQQMISGEKIRKYNWIVFEDSPHEIMSYLNMRKETNADIDFYIPDWSYNSHINAGKKVLFEGKERNSQVKLHTL